MVPIYFFRFHYFPALFKFNQFFHSVTLIYNNSVLIMFYLCRMLNQVELKLVRVSEFYWQHRLSGSRDRLRTSEAKLFQTQLYRLDSKHSFEKWITLVTTNSHILFCMTSPYQRVITTHQTIGKVCGFWLSNITLLFE